MLLLALGFVFQQFGWAESIVIHDLPAPFGPARVQNSSESR